MKCQYSPSSLILETLVLMVGSIPLPDSSPSLSESYTKDSKTIKILSLSTTLLVVLILHLTPCQPAGCCPTVTLTHLSATPATPSLGTGVQVPSGALQAKGGEERGQPLCRSSFIFSVGEEYRPSAFSLTWEFPLFFNGPLKALCINFLSLAYSVFFHLLSPDLLLLIRNRYISYEDVRCCFPEPSSNM